MRVMYSRLIKFLDRHSLLFSYLANVHTRYMAIMTMVEKVTKCLDYGDFSFGVFLDLSKACDTVNHYILMRRLSYYGIRDNALAWFHGNLLHMIGYLSRPRVLMWCITGFYFKSTVILYIY